MSTSSVARAVARALIAARDPLNEADSAAGDGDLGITASTLGEVLNALADELDGLAPGPALRRVGLEIGSRAPSTFGTLISLGFIGASRTVADAPDAEPTPAEEAARVAAAVESAITTRGKAARGGKTLLDALGPAVEALHGAAASGASLADAVAAAATAAESGADATRALEPTMGRQAWLADRARGNVDPGALAVSIAFRAAADAVAASAEDGQPG